MAENMSAGDTYSQKINTTTPGLIVILLDQSASMASQISNGQTKSIAAARAVNRAIYAIVRRSSRGGTRVVNRCYVGVIGYGKSVKPIVGGWTSELDSLKAPIGADGLKQYITPRNENGTPMDRAFLEAYPLVRDWVDKNPNGFPPIVINITDGEPNDMISGPKDGSLTKIQARKLLDLATSDGRTLLFNIHIGSAGLGETILPTADQVRGLKDNYADYLFGFSSEIPYIMRISAKNAGFDPQPGARAMAFGAADKLVQLLDWGSSTLLR